MSATVPAAERRISRRSVASWVLYGLPNAVFSMGLVNSPIRSVVRGVACGAVLVLGAAGPLAAQASPDSLVRAAIAAAAGPAALSAIRALEWEARAVVHVPGRDIVIRGLWRVQPPDSGRRRDLRHGKRPGDDPPAHPRGREGWIQADSQLTPVPADVLAEERHQFYLYSLLRLVPLTEPSVRLQSVTPDDAGGAGIRVERSDRLPVTLYVDGAGRVSRIVTTFATASGGPADRQEIRLSDPLLSGPPGPE